MECLFTNHQRLPYRCTPQGPGIHVLKGFCDISTYKEIKGKITCTSNRESPCKHHLFYKHETTIWRFDRMFVPPGR